MNTFKVTLHCDGGYPETVLWLDATSRAHALKQAATHAIKHELEVVTAEVEE